MKRFIVLSAVLTVSLLTAAGMAEPERHDSAEVCGYASLMAYADSCVDNFDIFHALEAYRRAMTLNDNSRVRRQIAKCHYRRAEFRECVDMLRSISKLTNDSLDHEALREMFYSHGRLGNKSAQTYWGGEVVKRYPYDAEIVAALASVYISSDIPMPSKALEYTDAYLANDSTNMAVMRQRADALFFLEQYSAAAEAYQRLVSRGDTTYNTCYSLGVSYMNRQNNVEARRWLLKAAEQNGYKSPGCLYRLGMVCSQVDSLSEAVKYLDKAYRLMQPDDMSVFSICTCIGSCYYKMGDYMKARFHYSRALRSSNRDPMAYFRLADTSGKIGDRKEEHRCYLNFLSLTENAEQTEDLVRMREQARAVVGSEEE